MRQIDITCCFILECGHEYIFVTLACLWIQFPIFKQLHFRNHFRERCVSGDQRFHVGSRFEFCEEYMAEAAGRLFGSQHNNRLVVEYNGRSALIRGALHCRVLLRFCVTRKSGQEGVGEGPTKINFALSVRT